MRLDLFFFFEQCTHCRPPSSAPRSSAGHVWRSKLPFAGYSIVLPAEAGGHELFDIVWDDPQRYMPVCGVNTLRDPRHTQFKTEDGRLSIELNRRPGNQQSSAMFPGGHRRGVTPVPIPNTEVKLSTADGTARVTAWESRSLPGLFSQARFE